MSTALEGLGDGVGECDLEAGSKRDFTLKFDPNKVDVEKIAAALKGTGHGISKTQ